MLEGLKLAIEHSQATIVIQSDCAVALKMLGDGSLDRSAYGHLVSEIKSFLNDRVVIPVKILREQNRVALCLANFVVVERCTVGSVNHQIVFLVF